MKKGKVYYVVFMRGYEIFYENHVKCIKVCPKSYRVERQDKTNFLVPKDRIIELKQPKANDHA